jgi:hypothetical protein
MIQNEHCTMGHGYWTDSLNKVGVSWNKRFKLSIDICRIS